MTLSQTAIPGRHLRPLLSLRKEPAGRPAGVGCTHQEARVRSFRKVRIKIVDEPKAGAALNERLSSPYLHVANAVVTTSSVRPARAKNPIHLFVTALGAERIATLSCTTK